MRLAATLAVLLACGTSNKVDKLERQVADLEDELAQERKERRRAERKLDDEKRDVKTDRPPVDERAEANKAYDRGEFERARLLALKYLTTQPDDVRMLRLVVSSSCMLGDRAGTQPHYDKLSDPDRRQMKTRCARQGIDLPD